MNRELMKKDAENWACFWLLPERPSADIWEEARVRIVELAPPRITGALISYLRLLRAPIIYSD